MKNMSFQRIYAIFLRQFFLLRRSPPRFIGIFYWSTFELFMWGIITKYLANVGGEKFSSITVIVGAMIFWGFFNRVQQGITVSFLEDIWSRNLINLFVSPLTIGEYVGGLMLVSFTNTVLSFLAMFLVAWLLFAYNIFQFGFLLLPYIFILFLFGWAIGILVTAAIMRFGPSVEVIVWAMPTLIMPFASIFYPVSALPEILQPIARVVPISYVFEGMRQVVHSGTFDVYSLIVAAVLSTIFLGLSIWIFLGVFKIVLRKGLFTRFMTD